MDAHNPSHIRLLIHRTRAAIVHLVFLQLLHITDKGKKAMAACLFKRRCPQQQHFQIGPAAVPFRIRRHILHISRFRHGCPQQFLHRFVYGTYPVSVNQIQKPPGFTDKCFRVVRCLLIFRLCDGQALPVRLFSFSPYGCLESFIQSPFRICGPDMGNIVIRKCADQ